MEIFRYIFEIIATPKTDEIPDTERWVLIRDNIYKSMNIMELKYKAEDYQVKDAMSGLESLLTSNFDNISIKVIEEIVYS